MVYTIAEFERFMKQRVEAYVASEIENMSKHPDWYENKGPEDFRTDLGSWWEGLNAFEPDEEGE